MGTSAPAPPLLSPGDCSDEPPPLSWHYSDSCALSVHCTTRNGAPRREAIVFLASLRKLCLRAGSVPVTQAPFRSEPLNLCWLFVQLLLIFATHSISEKQMPSPFVRHKGPGMIHPTTAGFLPFPCSREVSGCPPASAGAWKQHFSSQGILLMVRNQATVRNNFGPPWRPCRWLWGS